jgi:hypothetical protein
MKHRCPVCEAKIGAQTIKELTQLCIDLNDQDTFRISVTGECGRSIVLAHVLNILRIEELLNADPEVDKWSLDDLIAEAKKTKPLIELYAAGAASNAKN